MKRNTNPLPFGKRNYQLLLVGILVLALGFTLIALDQAVHGFGVLGLTIGPLTVVIGFVIECLVIMYRDKQDR